MLRVFALLVVVAGCKSGITAPADMAAVDMTPPAPLQKVDVLFMIDNTTSAPMISELRNRFPVLIKALGAALADGHRASYHFGVITSDLGAGPYTLNNGQCHPDGDGGMLQLGAAAGSFPPPSCASFSLGGARYISLAQQIISRLQ